MFLRHSAILRKRDMNPMLGYPRLILFDGRFSGCISLQETLSPLVALRTLKYWRNALFVTEHGHCFRVEEAQVARILTPWYFRWWKEPTYVEAHYKTHFCPQLSFDNVYPVIWRALDVATSVEVALEKDGVLNDFSTRPRTIGSCDGGFISKRMKARLKKLLEQRVPLRTFFENYVEMIKNHSLNSPYL